MRKIYKYELDVLRWETQLELPVGARVVHVAAQNPRDATVVTLWVLFNPGMLEREIRTFVVVGTGHDIPYDDAEYLGVAICHDGALVWHVLELR